MAAMLEMLTTAPLALPHHDRQRVLAGQEHALEVEVKHVVPLGLRQLDRAAHAGVADVVVQHVDAAMPAHGVRHRLRHAVRPGDVRRQRLARQALGTGQVPRGLGRCQVAVDRHHQRARPAIGHRGGVAVAPAQPDAPGAEHQRDPAGEFARRSLDGSLGNRRDAHDPPPDPTRASRPMLDASPVAPHGFMQN